MRPVAIAPRSEISTALIGVPMLMASSLSIKQTLAPVSKIPHSFSSSSAIGMDNISSPLGKGPSAGYKGVGTTYGMPRRMSTSKNRPDVIIVITRDLSAEEISRHFEQSAVKLYPMTGIAPSAVTHRSQLSLSSPRSFYASNDL
jgi:hypothetical protein